MTRIDKLRQKVRTLYQSQDPNRDEWSDWLYLNHVLVVADYAKELAGRKGADAELAEVAALLHDIADSRMPRVSENHETVSLEIGRELMQECGYDDEEVKLVIDDAVTHHSCRGDDRPESVEGLVLAAADSLAHFKSDFYIYASWAHGRDWSLEKVKEWVTKKIEKDLNNKIAFEDVREDCRPDYEMVKTLFSR